MFKRTTVLIAAVATTTTLTACASSGASDEGGDDSGPLVIYSNSVSDGRGEWLQDLASENDFEIEFVDLGGGDIQNRLLAEQANPIADVVFGLNNVFFENLKASDVLEPNTPAWSDKVEAGLGDNEQYWPIVREPIMLVYNDETFSEAEAPSDWTDLWNENEFQGRYETPTGLGGATTQMVLSGILSRYLDEDGELGVSDEGWAEIEKYFEHGSPQVQGTDLYARMANGEVDAGQMWLAGKEAREEEYGIRTEAAHPTVGVPMAIQHIGLVNDSSRPEKAKEFIDWFGSAEVQATWSNEFFTAPTNEDALADADQDAVESTNEFEAQDIDWEVVAENLPDWIEKIELQFM